ncbi:MAG: hypothetical protein RSE62_12710 [Citrobacter sp.]
MKYYVMSKSDYAPSYYFTVDNLGRIDLISVFPLPAGYGRDARGGEHFKPKIPQHYVDFITKTFSEADKSTWWGGHEMVEKEFRIWSIKNGK